MSFEEQIKMLIDEADIPESLSPDNIALMLKEKTAETNRNKIQHKTSGSVKSNNRAITLGHRNAAAVSKSKSRAIALRSTAAVAACIALTFGVIALVDDTGTPVALPEITQENKASDYHDVYSVIQGTIISNTASEGQETIWAEQIPDTVTPATVNKTEKYAVSDFTSGLLEDADILKTDGTNLYYIANGTLYFISADSGEMTELLKVQSGDKIPADMYVMGDKLVVISNHTVEVPYEAGADEKETTPVIAADSSETTSAETSAEQPKLPETVKQNNTVVDIYNISDKTSPKLENTYKQNGAYISSGMSGTSLYLATNYSNFRTKPLDSETDLDNYVPSYYINSDKYYVDVKDIVIPSKASGAYSIVSGFDISQPSPFKSVKAVLSHGKYAYFTDNVLYLVGNNGKNESTITKFGISGGMVEATECASVSGTYNDVCAMDVSNGYFRISTVNTDAKTSNQSAGIYIFNDKLVPVGTIEKLGTGTSIELIGFDGTRAFVVTAGSNTPTEVSLSDVASPVKLDATSAKSVYLYNYGNGLFLEFSAISDESGNQTGVKLAMVKTLDGVNYIEAASTEMAGTFSNSVYNGYINSKALIIDSEKNIIGIPLVSSDTYGSKNMYSLFSYTDGAGFTKLGTIEYTDIDSKYEFERAVRVNDTLYVFSDGRAVSAQASDLKVIQTLELK